MKRKFWAWPMAILMAVLSPLASLAPVNAAEDLKPVVSDGSYVYEVEKGELSEGVFVENALTGFSGESYVNIGNGSVTLNIDVPIAGNYRIYFVGSTQYDTDDRWESVYVNNEAECWVALRKEDCGKWARYEIGRNPEWVDGRITSKPVTEGYAMAQGHNTVRIQANWGYAYYDQLILVPTAEDSSKLINVISLIDALPETIQESNRNDVNYAKKAYDALSAEQKAQVTNYEKLEKALAALVQKPVIDGDKLIYEAEYSDFLGAGGYIGNTMEGYSGTGYAFIMTDGFEMKIQVPEAGKYYLSVVSANDGNGARCEKVVVNGGIEYLVVTPGTPEKTWYTSEPVTGYWTEQGELKPVPVEGGMDFVAGENSVKILTNWGYAAYDKIILTPVEKGDSKVTYVMTLIDALPETIQESNRNDVNFAKKAYDALSAEQKAQVTNYEKLEKALAALIQKPTVDGDKLIYEAEYSDFLGDGGYIGNTISGYSGTGYAFIMTDGFEMKIQVPQAGKYRLMVVGANEGNGGRCEKVVVNEGAEYFVATPAKPEKTWIMSEIGTENWVNDELKPQPIEGGISLAAGVNSVKILANWGYAAYDKIVLIPYASNSLGDINNIEKANDLITKLPEVITAGDIQSVEEAFAIYNALSPADKAGVKNVEKLIRARAAALALKADAKVPKGALRFECEEGNLVGNTAVVNSKETFPSYSGNGYVFLFDKEFSVDVYVAKSGYYDIAIVSGTTENANKCDYVSINGGEKYLISTLGKKGVWRISQPGTEFWENGSLKPQAPKGGFYLKAGKNTITISANWGYCAYDSIIVYPYGTAPNTGDHQFSMNTAGIMMLASATVVGVTVVRRRKEEDYEGSNNQ